MRKGKAEAALSIYAFYTDCGEPAYPINLIGYLRALGVK
jgi:hypothetical protein